MLLAAKLVQYMHRHTSLNIQGCALAVAGSPRLQCTNFCFFWWTRRIYKVKMLDTLDLIVESIWAPYGFLFIYQDFLSDAIIICVIYTCTHCSRSWLFLLNHVLYLKALLTGFLCHVICQPKSIAYNFWPTHMYIFGRNWRLSKLRSRVEVLSSASKQLFNLLFKFSYYCISFLLKDISSLILANKIFQV